MALLIDRHSFWNTIATFELVPFTQTEAWYNYVYASRPEDCLFFVNDPNKPTIACVAFRKRILGLTLLQVEGLCIKNNQLSSASIRSFLQALLENRPEVLECNFNQPQSVKLEVALRQVGYTRPLASFSSRLSLWIPLDKNIQYNQNWKRNLKRAQSFDLFFEVVQNPSDKEVDEFYSMYQNLQEHKGFRFSLNKKDIAALLSDSTFKLAKVKDTSGTTLCSIMYHQIKQHAGLLHATKIEEAKESGATFYMYQQLFAQLAHEGVRWFDMEKLVPSTDSRNSVFQFKNGIKGEYVYYLGEWAWYKRPFYRYLMYWIKKVRMKKVEI